MIPAPIFRRKSKVKGESIPSSSKNEGRLRRRLVALGLFFCLLALLLGPQGAQALPSEAPLAAPTPGLQGEYFSNPDLRLPRTLTRMDNAVNFFWVNDDTPDDTLPPDNFSVRWSGQVQAQYSEAYTFHTFSDDGVRLWVDGQLLIDNWTIHGTEEDTGSILLQAGEWYNLRLEYFEGGGEARMRLEWSSPSTPQAVVPSTALRYPDLTNATLDCSPTTQTADGLSSMSITVEMLDEAFNPITGQPISVQITGDFNTLNTLGVVPGAWISLGVTNDSGIATGTLTSTLAETKHVLVKAGDVVLPPEASCTFIPGEVTELQILLPGETPAPGDPPGWVGGPDLLVVGQSTKVRLRAVDANGNLVTDFTEEVLISTSDPEAIHPPSFPLNSGEESPMVTWMNAGDHTLSVTAVAQPTLTSEHSVEVLGGRIPALKGDYYNNADLTPPITATRYDSQIDFLWTGFPIDDVWFDNFSVHWHGQLTPEFSETYTFHTFSDDGVRLWINGQLLIEHWDDHGLAEDQAQVALIGGEPVDLRMEFYDRGFDAIARLEWSSPSTPQQVIPAERLAYLEHSGSSATFTAPATPADGGTPAVLNLRIADAADTPYVSVPIELMVVGDHTQLNGVLAEPNEWIWIGITDINGEISANLTSTKAEVKQVFIRAEGQILELSPNTVFIPGPTSQLLILLPGEMHDPGSAPGKTGLPETIELDRDIALQVLAVDQYWNLATVFDDPLRLESLPGTAVHPELIFPVDGEATLTVSWSELGPQSLTVIDTLDELIQGSLAVEVQPRTVITIADGETHYVDEARFQLFVPALPGGVEIFHDGNPAFQVGDDILLMNVRGDDMGVHEIRRIVAVLEETFLLNAPLTHAYGTDNNQAIVQKIPRYGDMVVQSGGLITAHAWDGLTGGIVMLQAENLTIEAGGKIDANKLGFGPTEGPGSGGYAAGGGYGGAGGDDPGGAQGGPGYGLTMTPIALGSAGGDASQTANEGTASGGHGGGIVRLQISDTLQVDGSIEARGDWRTGYGEQEDVGGGGSGGSIWLEVGTLSGEGRIYAYGGGSYYIIDLETDFIEHGGGAGGRLAIYADEDTYSGQINLRGSGPNAGPGTQYIENTTTGQSTLQVDNYNASTKPALLIGEGDTSWGFDTVELLRNGDLAIPNPLDFILLSPGNMAGDGTGQLHLYAPMPYLANVVSGFGFYIHETSTLSTLTMTALTVQGAELTIQGTLENVTDLTVLPDGEIDGTVTLGARGHTSGNPAGTYTLNTVQIHPGQTLAIEGDPISGLGVTVQVTTMEVQDGGHLTADGLGYQPDGDQGPGASDITASAGHGGYGGSEYGGIPYGDAIAPLTLGSAGSGAGGGALHLIADQLVLEGSLTANGDPAERHGGAGAGGSLWLDIGTLSGSGVIQANGGDRYPIGADTSGGGGRISLTTSSSTFTGSIEAFAGAGERAGGPGTIVVTDLISGERSLIIDNQDQTGSKAGLTNPAPTDWIFNRIELVREGNLELMDPDDTLPLTTAEIIGDATAQITLHGSVTYTPPELTSFGFVVAHDGQLTLSSDLTLRGTELSVEGELIGGEHMVVEGGSGHSGRLDLSATGHHLNQDPGTYLFESLTLEQGQILGIQGDPANGRGVTIITDSMQVSYEALVDANGTGYPPGQGPGTAIGAGHGGYGGGVNGGTAYGSLFQPIDLGSGGRGNGGGALRIITTDLVVDGTISVDGSAGGGAGGSVWLDVGSFDGNGVVRANGGAGNRYSSDGSGAGGRIAVYYDENLFGGELLAHSRPNAWGNHTGGAGTIYLQDTTLAGDSLIVDNAGYPGERAVLADETTTLWDFDRIELRARGDLETLDPGDTIALSTEIMFGDGTAQIYLHNDLTLPFSEIHGFGLYMPEGTTLTVPENFTIAGVPLNILGEIAGVQNLTLEENLDSTSYLSFGPQASTLGFEPRNYSFMSLTIENYTHMNLASDPATGSGVVLNVGDLTVAGQLFANGLGYTPAQNGPGAPGDENSGAGHGGMGSGPAGGVIYGSLTEPITLGSAGFNQYFGNGGGAIKIVADMVTIPVTGKIAADADTGVGGAGGSLWIEAQQVLGEGSLTARGGKGLFSVGGGGGGGGRIAVYAGVVDPNLEFYVEGTYPSPGETGTVYFGGVDPQQSSFSIEPLRVPANGTSTATITLRDGGSNPLPNLPVELTLALGPSLQVNGTDVLPGNSIDLGLTDVDGQVIATLYTTQAGVRLLEARSGQVVLSDVASVEFIPGPVDPTNSRIWAQPLVAAADGSMQVWVSVQARDSFDNLIPGLPVVLETTGSVVVTQPTELTDESGITQGSLVSSIPEDVTISASIDTVDINEKATVTFAGADLAVHLSGPTLTAPSAIYTYKLDVHNAGELPAENVTLTQVLPPEVEFEFHNAPVEPSVDGDTFTWDLGTLAVDQRVLFSVGVQVPFSTPLGTVLMSSINTTTTSVELDSSNNNANHSLEVVEGNGHSVSLPVAEKTIGLGGTGTFNVVVKNTGLLGDRFTLSLIGLDTGWYSFESVEVALSPGGSVGIPLVVKVEDCASAGTYSFTVQVTSEATGAVETAGGTLNLRVAPLISALQPRDGLELGARDVAFSWHTDAPASGIITLEPFSEPEARQMYNTPTGNDHSVVVEGLERDTTYIWNVQADSACGVGTSLQRQFTITNGVVFGERQLDVTIDRDYNQRFQVGIVNTDVVEHTVKLNVENPHEDLILNFVGRGSVDEAITLLPGESRLVEMAVHAQDAASRQYQLTAVVQSDEPGDPIRDTATLNIRVLFDADFYIEEASRDPISEAVTYRVVNQGTTLTDLSVQAIDPVTGEPAQVFLSPSIAHYRLNTDVSLEFTVFPLYGPEDVGEPLVSTGSDVLMSVRRQQGVREYDLLVEAGGVIRNAIGTIDCWASGKQVYPLTLDQVVLTCKGGGWYCTNKPDIDIPFPMPWFVRPEVIVGSHLSATFTPYEGVRPHSVSLSFNDEEIKSFSHTIPEGTYRIPVPPSAYNSSFETGVVMQTLHLDSQHSNFAHYIVATDFTLQAALEGSVMYVCAPSPDQVFEAASGVCEINPLASEMDVEINWPKESVPVNASQTRAVNIQASVWDDVEPFYDQYTVDGTISYLDEFGEVYDEEPIEFFNDGLDVHQDDKKGDNFYSAIWYPRASGMARITVHAVGVDPLLVDEDSILVEVISITDLAVTSVYPLVFPRVDQVTQVVAEITNYGELYDDPVLVKFEYFNVDRLTLEATDLIAHNECVLFREGGNLLGGQSILVIDQSYTPDEAKGFRARATVVLDPPGDLSGVASCQSP